MKYLLLLLTLFSLGFSNQTITNETNEPMQCIVSYPAVYEQELIHGIKQRIQTQKEESFTKILKPNKTLVKKRAGSITCYNKQAYLSTYRNSDVKKYNERQLESFVTNQEMFDISSYINENREFVDAKYGIMQECKPYKGGEYCKKANGLDIFFNKEGRVKKIFIYGNALYAYRKNLVFEKESLGKIQVNSKPLGLWVSAKNKKLIKTKPSFISDNAIIYKNPSKGIKSIVMTSMNGHKQLRRSRYQRDKNADNEKLQDYLKAIEIEYVLDDKAYALHQKTRVMPKKKFKSMKRNYVKKNLPIKAKSTWAKHLNPTNKIPKNKFKAFYINTNNPKKVIASDIVDSVNINYVSNKFHKIKSEDFGAYWVGEFVYKKKQEVQIGISQSWAKSRIIIDGMVVYEGSNNHTMPYTFTKGKHKIEVEYVNNWHTTDFKVVIKAKEKIYNKVELQKELKKYSTKKAQLIFVSVSKSADKKNQSVVLKIAKSSKPIILAINSYHSVNWVIKNPHKVKIQAIVYASRKIGTSFSGDIKKSTPILKYIDTIGSYSMKKRCSCINGGAVFLCDGKNALDVLAKVQKIMDKKVFAYSYKKRAEVLMVPSILFDAKAKKRLKLEILDIKNQEKECRKKSNPEFENMFDN